MASPGRSRTTDCPAARIMSRGSRSCVIQVTPLMQETRVPLPFSMRCTDRAASEIGSRVTDASMIDLLCMRCAHLSIGSADAQIRLQFKNYKGIVRGTNDDFSFHA